MDVMVALVIATNISLCDTEMKMMELSGFSNII